MSSPLPRLTPVNRNHFAVSAEGVLLTFAEPMRMSRRAVGLADAKGLSLRGRHRRQGIDEPGRILESTGAAAPTV